MTIRFKKMHGLGNDFVIIDCREGELPLSREQMATITHRKTGVGSDQLILLMPPQSEDSDIFMKIMNAPDASEAQACGNATRCVADILITEKSSEVCVIQTVAGLLKCQKEPNGQITVDMGVPGLNWDQIPLAQECDTLHIPIEGDPVGVNIGNPHAVFFLDEDVETYPLSEIGPKMEHDPIFPEKANVEFCNVLDRNHVRMRVWERGAGITQACGSGACAAAVAAIRRGLTDRKVTIQLDGGDLIIEWREGDGHLLMTGPVAYVFDGELGSSFG